jgi:hypothetical protein
VGGLVGEKQRGHRGKQLLRQDPCHHSRQGCRRHGRYRDREGNGVRCHGGHSLREYPECRHHHMEQQQSHTDHLLHLHPRALLAAPHQGTVSNGFEPRGPSGKENMEHKSRLVGLYRT